MSRSLRAAAIAGVSALALGLATLPHSAQAADTTLNLFAADYGTGPANSSQIYWQGIADAFHAANPDITVKVRRSTGTTSTTRSRP